MAADDVLVRAKEACNSHMRIHIITDLMEELIAEIERLQNLIDKPPEEADWIRDEQRLSGEITTDVVQVARKWHSAYRKSQNSNLIRRQWCEQKDAMIQHQAVRIKELEAETVRQMEIGRIYKQMAEDMSRHNERLGAAFLVEKEATLWDTVVVEGPKEGRAARHIAIVQQKARDALEQIKTGGKDEKL